MRLTWGTLLLVAIGCAPSLATLQPAHVAPRGHVQVTAGIEVAIPTGAIVRTLDSGRTLAKAAQTRMLSDADLAKFYDTGVVLVSSPPSVSQHFAIAYSLLDRTEIGLRYAGEGWRLGGRYQLLRHEDQPFDMVVGAGIARATTSIPLGDVVPYLAASDFTRWTLDLPLLIGTSRDWFRVWAGSKLMYSRFDAALSIALPMNDPQVGSLEGHVWYIAAQAGVAVGYRHVFFGAELTMGEIRGSGSVTGTSPGTPPSDIDGFIVYPALALMGEF